MQENADNPWIVGVDEAGRGPLAGPVVAAAVMVPQNFHLRGLGDSKKVTKRRRESLDLEIKKQAIGWAIGEANVNEIDTLNILRATLLAMSRAVDSLSIKPNLVLIDGCHVPHLVCEVRAVVKGDASVPAISAASILAKVYRDRMMTDFHRQFPEYGFDTNMGYPTRHHIHALKTYGATRIHRTSFAPVRSVVGVPGGASQ